MLKLLAVFSQQEALLSVMYECIPTPFFETQFGSRFLASFSWVQTMTPGHLKTWVSFCSKKLETFPENSKSWFECQFKKALIVKLAYSGSNKAWIDAHLEDLGLFKKATLDVQYPQEWVLSVEGVSEKVTLDVCTLLGSGTFGAVNAGRFGEKDIAIKRITISGYWDLFSVFSESMMPCVLSMADSQNGAQFVSPLCAFLVRQQGQLEAWLVMDRYPKSLADYAQNSRFELIDTFFDGLNTQIQQQGLDVAAATTSDIQIFLQGYMNSVSHTLQMDVFLNRYEQIPGLLNSAFHIYKDLKDVIQDSPTMPLALGRIRLFFDSHCSFEVGQRGRFPGFKRHLGFVANQFGVMDQIFCDIARTLAHIHAQKLVYADLKEGNVLLDHANRAFLTDFGLTYFYNPDFYSLFSVDLAGIGGTYRPPFVFNAATANHDFDGTKDVNVRKLLQRKKGSCDLRNVDVFSFGAMIATYFSGHPIGLNEVQDKGCMQQWVSDVSHRLRDMTNDQKISSQKKFWIDVAQECLAVSFDKPVVMDDIIDRVAHQNAVVRRGAVLALDGVISFLEQHAT